MKNQIIGALALALAASGCTRGVDVNKGTPSTPPAPTLVTASATRQGGLSAVWANDGGDKITQEELRSTKNGAQAVTNTIWDGNQVNLFAAKNEVVAFNLVLEAGAGAVTDLKVAFNKLVGPGQSIIASQPVGPEGLFDWTNRNIEIFAVRYLQIKGLSRLSYETYDERHVPTRFRRPWTGAGIGRGSWADRPDHDKFYPDIAVPLELTDNKVSIAQGKNQSVWVDIYVPKNATTGIYRGTIVLAGPHAPAQKIPVQLEVKNFALPDQPTAKTMVNLGYSDIATRYTGVSYPAAGSSADNKVKLVRDRHFMMAHRHKISLIDGDQGAGPSPGDRPREEWLPRLDGSLFTVANGYHGPGEGTGNNVYSIGTYGSWGWKSGGESAMQSHSNAWANWFQTHAPNTDYFLYLIDESSNYAQTQNWAQWIASNPGVGKALSSLATVALPSAISNEPALSIAASWFTVGDTATWQNAYTQAKAAGKKVFMYNGKRPSNGSFATEDDGVALRELAWAQYKKGIDRWFFWESTYYNDNQGGRGQTDVFQNAQTFGGPAKANDLIGASGWNSSNGDGLLFYPGSDTVFPASSYGVSGPIASLRLKMWRRGIQDVDYIAAAAAVNPALTQIDVDRMVPRALWDYGIDDPADPTWVRTDISWSCLPEDWENARLDLANIIEGKATTPAALHASRATPLQGARRAPSFLKKVLHRLSSEG